MCVCKINNEQWTINTIIKGDNFSRNKTIKPQLNMWHQCLMSSHILFARWSCKRLAKSESAVTFGFLHTPVVQISPFDSWHSTQQLSLPLPHPITLLLPIWYNAVQSIWPIKHLKLLQPISTVSHKNKAVCGADCRFLDLNTKRKIYRLLSLLILMSWCF